MKFLRFLVLMLFFACAFLLLDKYLDLGNRWIVVVDDTQEVLDKVQYFFNWIRA